jgi:hypothetical protein
LPPKHPALRDEAARNQLVEQWHGLPRYVAGALCRSPSIRRVIRCESDFDDLAAAGHLPLLRAAELWDETCGVKFVTYACASIRLRMFRYLGVRFSRCKRLFLEAAPLPVDDTLAWPARVEPLVVSGPLSRLNALKELREMIAAE